MLKVTIDKIEEGEKSMYSDLLKYYKFVFRCIGCKLLFGSDLAKHNGYCPRSTCLTNKEREVNYGKPIATEL